MEDHDLPYLAYTMELLSSEKPGLFPDARMWRQCALTCFHPWYERTETGDICPVTCLLYVYGPSLLLYVRRFGRAVRESIAFLSYMYCYRTEQNRTEQKLKL